VKLGDLIRPKVLVTIVLVLVVAMLVFFAITVALYGWGEEVPGDPGDVFP
jgi:hypothetical protein